MSSEFILSQWLCKLTQSINIYLSTKKCQRLLLLIGLKRVQLLPMSNCTLWSDKYIGNAWERGGHTWARILYNLYKLVRQDGILILRPRILGMPIHLFFIYLFVCFFYYIKILIYKSLQYILRGLLKIKIPLYKKDNSILIVSSVLKYHVVSPVTD